MPCWKSAQILTTVPPLSLIELSSSAALAECNKWINVDFVLCYIQVLTTARATLAWMEVFVWTVALVTHVNVAHVGLVPTVPYVSILITVVGYNIQTLWFPRIFFTNLLLPRQFLESNPIQECVVKPLILVLSTYVRARAVSEVPTVRSVSHSSQWFLLHSALFLLMCGFMSID